jgi:hypothetical protein
MLTTVEGAALVMVTLSDTLTNWIYPVCVTSNKKANTNAATLTAHFHVEFSG